MDDIARLANVDKSTVSRALAGNKLVTEETREHVRRIAEEQGYIVNSVASGLRSRKSKVIAVVVPLAHDARQSLSDPFFMELVGNLADRFAEHGYDLLLSKVPRPNSSWITSLYQSRKADGVVLIGQSLEHEHISDAGRQGIPLVVWGARIRDQAYISVGTNNRQGAMLATQHLIDKGRRKIAFVGDWRVPEIAQRHEGYLAALRESGLPAHPDLTAETHFEPDAAFEAVDQLITRVPGLDGIVASSDVIAMAAIRALAARKLRVPEDVSVTGFDDIALASQTSPPLTTVRQDIPRGAVLLTERIMASMEGKPVRSIEMKPTLVVRGSS
jgi:DNA-binding LacI/PurR family transcriptional regulator